MNCPLVQAEWETADAKKAAKIQAKAAKSAVLSEAAARALSLGLDFLDDVEVARCIKRQEKGADKRSVRLDGAADVSAASSRPTFSNIFGGRDGDAGGVDKATVVAAKQKKQVVSAESEGGGGEAGSGGEGVVERSKLPVKKAFTIGSKVGGKGGDDQAMKEAWGRDREFGGGYVEEYEPEGTEEGERYKALPDMDGTGRNPDMEAADEAYKGDWEGREGRETGVREEVGQEVAGKGVLERERYRAVVQFVLGDGVDEDGYKVSGKDTRPPQPTPSHDPPPRGAGTLRISFGISSACGLTLDAWYLLVQARLGEIRLGFAQ